MDKEEFDKLSEQAVNECLGKNIDPALNGVTRFAHIKDGDYQRMMATDRRECVFESKMARIHSMEDDGTTTVLELEGVQERVPTSEVINVNTIADRIVELRLQATTNPLEELALQLSQKSVSRGLKAAARATNDVATKQQSPSPEIETQRYPLWR